MKTLLLLTLLAQIDRIGVVLDGVFSLPGLAPFAYGATADTPLLGDWTGSGTSTPAVYRNGVFFFRHTLAGGASDSMLVFGLAGDLPFRGDWDGDGRDEVGLFRDGRVYLSNGAFFFYGQAGDVPVAGDWDGDGVDTIGIFRAGAFWLRNSNLSGYAEIYIPATGAGQPVAGDFDGDGRDEPRLVGMAGRVVVGHYTPPAPVPTSCEGIDVRSFIEPTDLDHYWMMARAAAALKDGDVLVFPTGTYRIGRYITRDQAGVLRESLENKVAALNDNRITFKNLKNITIRACGPVVIDVYGRFLAGHDEDGLQRLQVVPFSFEYCENVALEGFELRGNVQEMTRRLPQSYACVGYGIMSRASRGVRLSDINAHHFSCDGYTTGYWTYKGDGVDRDVTIERSSFHNNARQGMSVISTVGLTARFSRFEANGYTETPLFPALFPSCGVDIEPEDGLPETPDTTDINFEDSILANNLGMDLRAYPYGSLPQPRIGVVRLIRSPAVRRFLHPMVTLDVR